MNTHYQDFRAQNDNSKLANNFSSDVDNKKPDTDLFNLFTVRQSTGDLHNKVTAKDQEKTNQNYCEIGKPKKILKRKNLIIAFAVIAVIVIAICVAVVIATTGKGESNNNTDEPQGTQQASTGTPKVKPQDTSSAVTTTATSPTTISTDTYPMTTTMETSTELPEPPVAGEWAFWGSWTSCSATCGSGVHVRYRTCNKTFTDIDCEGEYVQKAVCTEKSCPTYGKWTTWSPWESCDASCGGGSQSRSRDCQKVSSSDIDCYGDTVQRKTCNEFDCPDCNRICTVGTLNEACDTCVCTSTAVEGRILSTFANPVAYAVLSEATAPLKIIAQSNSTGFFSLNKTCITSTLNVYREGFQEAVVEITDTFQLIYLNLEVLPRMTEQPQSKFRLTGEDVLFCCSAFSAPEITYYEWFRDALLIDKSLYINNGTGLELTNVQLKDSGKYTCRANNAQRAILSSPATLEVKDTEEEFCEDALQERKVNLPSTCVQAGTNTTLFEVGECISKTCRQEIDNETAKCTDSNHSCCVPSRFETKAVNCSDYLLELFVVKACSCGTCFVPKVTVSGKVVSARSFSAVRYAEIWLNGEFVTFTSSTGKFLVYKSSSVDKIVLTVKDTYNNIYLEATKVIRVPSGTGGSISVTIQLLEKFDPVIIDSTIDTVLSMKNSQNDSASPVAVIDIPANSFYRSDGTKFTGMVSCIETFIDPTDDTMKDTVPGVFQFIDEEGTTMNLASKGVFNLQFEDENGESLYIDGVLEVRFPENYNSNFTLWKLNKATGVWEPLNPTIQTNKRKRRQTEYTIGEIDMTQVETTDWFNIDEVIYLTEKPCFFRTRIYENINLLEESNMFKYMYYEMEMRRVQNKTLETYFGYFTPFEHVCFAAPCENTVGYIWAYTYSSVLEDNLYFSASEPFSPQNSVTYEILQDKSIGIVMKMSEFGPFYNNQAECDASEKHNSHLRFYAPLSPTVFTAKEWSRDLRPGTPEYENIQKKVWYPNRENVYSACFIKVKLDVLKTNESSDASLKFHVLSFGGTSSAVISYLFGIREFDADIALDSNFNCTEYKCSGTLEDTDIIDYTRVKIALNSDTKYRCQAMELKDSLIKYPFDNYAWNADWSSPRMIGTYRDYFSIYAPSDYGGSYGIYRSTTDNTGDPYGGREKARTSAYKECMRDHDVHFGGAALHLYCEVPDEK